MHTGLVPLAPRTIYEEASLTYVQAFVPLVRFAGLLALAVNLFVWMPPPELLRNVSWSILVSFFCVTMLASAAILPMAVELRGKGATATSTGLRGLRQHGVRFLLATAPVAIFNVLLILTWIGIALGVFVTVRLALLGPAIVLEESDVTDSYARSWELIGGLWTRTAAILLGALAPFALLASLLAVLDIPTALSFFLVTLAEALVVPFVAIVVLLLFEDYRQVKEGQRARSNERPSNGGL